MRERVDRFLIDLVKNPYSPPALNELAATYDVDEEVVGALVGQGRIVRVNETIAFGAEPFAYVNSLEARPRFWPLLVATR